jgi:hypothetical protein
LQDYSEKENFLDTKIICKQGEVLHLPKFMVNIDSMTKKYMGIKLCC